jgi:LPPG:FO 2-phospho-L-lactate transferase
VCILSIRHGLVYCYDDFYFGILYSVPFDNVLPSENLTLRGLALQCVITVLAGGTGSIKLIRGLVSQGCEISVVSNVADNFWLYGLYICPDIDTVIYGLADLLDPIRGWGIRGDTFECLKQIQTLREPAWFKIGDKDLATHILRTAMLKNGKSLSFITEFMRQRFAILARILPATDDAVETRILTNTGEMHLQEFWVKNQAKPAISGIRYEGIEEAESNPKVISAIKNSKLVIVAPGNPVTSIGPILAINGIKETLTEEREKIIAVSPIIAGTAISGPAVKYMQAIQIEPSAFGVAEFYYQIASNFVISKGDMDSARRISKLGTRVHQTNIVMQTAEDEQRLAAFLLNLQLG